MEADGQQSQRYNWNPCNLGNLPIGGDKSHITPYVEGSHRHAQKTKPEYCSHQCICIWHPGRKDSCLYHIKVTAQDKNRGDHRFWSNWVHGLKLDLVPNLPCAKPT